MNIHIHVATIYMYIMDMYMYVHVINTLNSASFEHSYHIMRAARNIIIMWQSWVENEHYSTVSGLI